MKSKVVSRRLGKIVLSLVCLLWVMPNAWAVVNAPELKCLAVSSAGNTTLTWVSPSDPGNEFEHYEVFVSANLGGPYTSTVVNGLGTTQYTDFTNDANLGSYFYFVQTVYDAGAGNVNSSSSDTGRSMLPLFVAVTDSTANIKWDALFSYKLPSSTGIYNVYRKIGAGGTFSLIGSSNYGNESFNDAFKVCVDMIYYRIEMEDASGCISVSSVLEDLFEDNTPPATPVFDSVTVDSVTNQVLLGWQASTSFDTKGYIILYWIQATLQYTIRDTVWGRLNTRYMETAGAIDPTIRPEQYTVAAFDSCFNPNANTSASADHQKTMWLQIIPNNCENTVTLKWTPYVNWDDLQGYEIMVSVNGDPFQVGHTVGVNDTIYTHQKTDDLALYCYKIRAINQGKTKSSTSNRKCALANSLVFPAKQYFKQVTVTNNNAIHITSLTDTTLPAAEYVLFRSLDSIENFFEVNRIMAANNPIIELQDYNAKVEETSYFYRIGIVDTCGSVMFISKPANSMFLSGVMEDDSLNVRLEWNPYLGWDAVGSGVSEYAIYRVVDGIREMVDSVDSFTTQYFYTMEEEIQMGANFCFEIEAREASGNKFNMLDVALSNQICFTKNLRIFVPNAFRPGGNNSIFKPVISFGELATYKMIIYDRWGGTIFETTDIYTGWDGANGASISPFGAYVYYIEVSNFTGATFKKQGTFVLLR